MLYTESVDPPASFGFATCTASVDYLEKVCNEFLFWSRRDYMSIQF
jgi:hypothetical protein